MLVLLRCSPSIARKSCFLFNYLASAGVCVCLDRQKRMRGSLYIHHESMLRQEHTLVCAQHTDHAHRAPTN
jgi:hypothetical protein